MQNRKNQLSFHWLVFRALAGGKDILEPSLLMSCAGTIDSLWKLNRDVLQEMWSGFRH